MYFTIIRNFHKTLITNTSLTMVSLCMPWCLFGGPLWRSLFQGPGPSLHALVPLSEPSLEIPLWALDHSAMDPLSAMGPFWAIGSLFGPS